MASWTSILVVIWTKMKYVNNVSDKPIKCETKQVVTTAKLMGQKQKDCKVKAIRMTVNQSFWVPPILPHIKLFKSLKRRQLSVLCLIPLSFWQTVINSLLSPYLRFIIWCRAELRDAVHSMYFYFNNTGKHQLCAQMHKPSLSTWSLLQLCHQPGICHCHRQNGSHAPQRLSGVSSFVWNNIFWVISS